MILSIANNAKNRKTLRTHAKEAMSDYSPIMTWLILDCDGDLFIIGEPQGQTSVTIGKNEYLIAKTGGFYKAHGDGAACNKYGEKYKTQKQYLSDLLGVKEYQRLFEKANHEAKVFDADREYMD